MDGVKPAELIAAARMTEGLVYVAGLAGVVAGTQLLRQGDLPMAIIVWTLTFVGGAVLRLLGWMARGIGQMMERTHRIETDLLRLNRNSYADEPPSRDEREGPYGPFGSRH